MKKTIFGKFFDLDNAQVLVTKIHVPEDNVPGFQVFSIFNGKNLHQIYSLETAGIRDESFNYYSQQHAEDFIKTFGTHVIPCP